MPRKDSEKKNKPVQTASIDGLVDICADEEGVPVFLFVDGCTLNAEKSRHIDGILYEPPPANSMPWLLPRADEVVGCFHSDNDRKLFDEIEKTIRDNCELPHDGLYPFLTAWVLLTHLVEKFNYSPLIIFYAVAAKGKTRTCRTILSMARRGVHLETLREADIIRKSSRFTCSMFFDIMDVWKKAERLGAEDVLLGRFDRGVLIPRVTHPEVKGFGDTQHFACFGPTLIATNEPTHRILDSRGLIITMRQSSRSFDNDPREHDFLHLRERATAFRARWLNQDLPDVKKPARDRLGDILRPIAQIFAAVTPDRMTELASLICSLEQARAEAQMDTQEGQIVKAILGLKGNVTGGKLETKKIVELVNEGKPERFYISPVSVGKRLSALGFSQARIGDQRGVHYDRRLIETLATQYGHELPETSAKSGESAVNSENERVDVAKSDARREADAADQSAQMDFCQPANTDSTAVSAALTDAPDGSGGWDADSVARYSETFRKPPM